jgi:hypothetical protein
MQTQNREGAMPSVDNKWQGRRMLLLLVFFFSVPMAAVLLMHHFNWHPQGRSHGELISPPRTLHVPGELMSLQGIYVEPELLRDKWSMVYIAHDCQQQCEERVHAMRQIHASFAKDIQRVQRILVASGGNLQGLYQRYPDLLILSQPESEVEALRAQFDLSDAPAGTDNRIYLVDPLGNLMMSFPDSVPAGDIRKDITRLLAYSWAG